MENQKHYFIVGLFVTITSIAGLFFAVQYLSARGTKYNEYAILFNKNVGNLTIGSAVTMQGISVGQVKKVLLLGDDTTVRAEIIVDSNFKIREDTVARLSESAISGIVKVELQNQGFSEEELVTLPYQDMPIIPSDNSTFEQVINTLPEMLSATNDILNKITLLLDEGNVENINNIIDKANQSMDGLLDASKQLPTVMKNVTELTSHLESISVKLDQSSDDLPEITENLSTTLKNVSALVETLDKETTETTIQLKRTMEKGNNALDAISNLGDKISNQPTSLILQPKYKGYRATE